MAKSIAVVGGGAAGLAAAIAAGRALRAAGADADEASVVVYEDDERVGRTILATGNGRCNFSNAQPFAAGYRNEAFAKRAFAALESLAGDRVAQTAGMASAAVCASAAAADGATGAPLSTDAASASAISANAVLRFFESCGLGWREEGQGRLYPVTNKASTVLDVLRAAARACGVVERCGNAVRAIEPPRGAGGRFTLCMADGAFERAEAVVVAVGGRYGIELLPEGIEAEPFFPVLGPLKTDVALVRALDNIRVRCSVELRRGGRTGLLAARERGEVLFRKYGVSGIAAFNLSRFAKPGDAIVIDLLESGGVLGDGLLDMREQGLSEKAPDALAMLLGRRAALAENGLAQTCGDVLRGLLLPLVAEAVCKAADVAPDSAPTDGSLERIARAASGLCLRVEGVGDARQCQVHRGGVAPGAVDPETMAVRGVLGLYAAGEMIDVDAPCGGFNLHWAWASGLLAGASAARSVVR